MAGVTFLLACAGGLIGYGCDYWSKIYYEEENEKTARVLSIASLILGVVGLILLAVIYFIR